MKFCWKLCGTNKKKCLRCHSKNSTRKFFEVFFKKPLWVLLYIYFDKVSHRFCHKSSSLSETGRRTTTIEERQNQRKGKIILERAFRKSRCHSDVSLPPQMFLLLTLFFTSFYWISTHFSANHEANNCTCNLSAQRTFSSSESAILLVSNKNLGLWRGQINRTNSFDWLLKQ